MEIPFPGWCGPGDAVGLQRKLSAAERLTEIALKLCDRDLPLRNKVAGPPPPDTQIMSFAAFEEFGKAVKTFRACVQLASTGYGQASQMLAAVVLQSSLVVIWAIKQGESVDERADLHARYGLQLDLEERRRIGIWKSLPNSDFLDASERADAATLFGSNAGGLWTGHASLGDLIDDLATSSSDEFVQRKTQALRVLAAHATSMIEATGLANHSYRITGRLPNGQDIIRVNIGPGEEACADALHVASGGLFSALDTVVKNYTPDLASETRRAEAFLWRAWRDPKELVDLRDTDSCPCDRPGTLWGECHKWTEELGTVKYVPFTDADLVNFTPFDPSKHRPHDLNIPEIPPSDLPEGPLILTFTFKLPFTLGLQDVGFHNVVLSDSWADSDDIAHFGKTPIVRIRLHNEPTDGFELWLPGAANALRSFFGDIEVPPTRERFAPIPGAYEQWVTLETPSGRLESESADDPAYAFHRALSVLNTLLTALELAESDRRISSVSTHEIGAVVFRGAWTTKGTWVRLGDLLMHIESFPFPLEPQSFDSIGKQLIGALDGLRQGRPFLMANLWHSRALRAFHQRGDNADCVVSIQTAAESMMYDLLREILVDLGKTSRQINAKVNPDTPFKSILTKEIPPRLGGDWDLTGNSPVAKYWKSVYMLRNRITHGGYSPTNRETEIALDAFIGVREYIGELLWRRSSTYPRTLLAKVGENGLVRRGWMSGAMRKHCEAFKNEPAPWYWPQDVAGR